MKSGEYLKTKDHNARAWGEYLSEFEWDYFGSFTFRKQYSSNGARRAYERFIRSAKVRPVQATFFGIERGEKYGRIHLHSLLQFAPEHRKSARTIWAAWFELYGGAKVEIPDSNFDVSAYAAKYASKDMVDYDLLGEPARPLGSRSRDRHS